MLDDVVFVADDEVDEEELVTVFVTTCSLPVNPLVTMVFVPSVMPIVTGTFVGVAADITRT